MDKSTLITILLVAGVAVISFSIKERLPYALGGFIIGSALISSAVSVVFKAMDEKYTGVSQNKKKRT